MFIGRELGVGYMNGNAAETLFDQFVVHAGSVLVNGCLTLLMWKCAEHHTANVG